MVTFDGQLRFATTSDARAISALIERCYGDTYVTPAYLDPAFVARLIETRDVTFAVAVTREGDVVGQVGLARTGQFGLYECGRSSVVDIAYRSLGLAKKLGRSLVDQAAPALGARFLWGRCVTSHLYAQGQGKSDGMTPIGLLFGLCPESFRASGISVPPQPVSVVVVARAVAGDVRPRTLALSGRDRERARETLGVLGVPVGSGRPTRAPGALGAVVERDETTGLTTVRFSRSAAPFDLDSYFGGLEDSGARLVWVDVPAEAAGAPSLVERLRDQGFSFGCYLPLAGPDGEDVLRLQRYLGAAPLELEEILVLDETRPLRDEIFAEALLPVGAVT